MSTRIDERLRVLGRSAALATAGIAAATLVGWSLRLPGLRSFLPGAVGMRPNAAVVAMLLAASLLLLSREPVAAWRRNLGRTGALLALAVATLTLLEYILGWDAGMDRLLLPQALAAAGQSGRMAAVAALDYLLLAAALLLAGRGAGNGRAGPLAALLAFLISLLSLLGYTFHVASLYTLSPYAAQSLPSALASFLLGAAVLLAWPKHTWIRELASEHAGGALLRISLPLLLGLTWLISWLSVEGARAGFYSEEVDQVFVAGPLLLFFSLFLYWMARALNRAGEQQRVQRLEVEFLNQQLEQRVTQRTAQLAESISELEREMEERRQAQEQLRQAARYSRSLLEASLDPLVTIGKDGKIMDVNRATEEATGAPRARLIGSDFSNYFTEPEKARQGYEQVFSRGRVQDYPLVIRQVSGRVMEVLYNATVFRNEAGEVEGIFAAARDVSERRRAERESQRLTRALQTLSECNEAVVRATDEASLLKQVCDIAVGVGGYRLAWVGYAEQGEEKTVRPMAQAGGEEGYLGTVNITWADSERGRGPTGTAIRTGEVAMCADTLTDPRFAPWREEAVRRGFRSSIVLPLKDEERVFGSLSIYAVEPHAFDAEEQRLLEELASDLSYGIVALRARAQVRALNVELEERVRRRTAELEESNRELESFTYSVSHDLRAPLRHVDGFSKIILEEYGSVLDEAGRGYLERVRQGTQFMGRLVDDLLNLSRVGRRPLSVQITGLGTLLEEVRQDLAAEQAGREVEWRIGALPFVECDPGLMKQVLANLLSNALKFTRPRPRAVIEVGETQAGGRRAVYVRDNGVGFSMKYADKLFGIFQRLHRQEDFEGTGVGLATVGRILHKHGGTVWAEAELDKGATFYFTLGPAEAAAERPAEIEEVAA